MNNILSKKRFFLSVVLQIQLIFILSCSAIAEEIGRGGYAGSFLRMGAGARALGMGDGSVALIDDGYATYYNPAGLVFLMDRWVTATYQTMALDRYQYYFGYAQAFESKGHTENERGLMRGGFSVGWFSSGVNHIDARDYDGADIGELSHNEHCFFFSFALNPDPRVAIGLSGKLLWNRFPGITNEGETISATGFGFDVGVLFKILANLSAGFTIRDLRSSYTWDTQNLWVGEGSQSTDTFPRILRGGLSWRCLSNRFILNGDLEKVEYWPLKMIAGIQFEAIDKAVIRMGLKGRAFSVGAGYRFNWMKKGLQMDYAYVPDSIAPGANHVFTWSFIF